MQTSWYFYVVITFAVLLLTLNKTLKIGSSCVLLCNHFTAGRFLSEVDKTMANWKYGLDTPKGVNEFFRFPLPIVQQKIIQNDPRYWKVNKRTQIPLGSTFVLLEIVLNIGRQNVVCKSIADWSTFVYTRLHFFELPAYVTWTLQ